MYLVYTSKNLDNDDNKLSDYNIQNNSTIFLLARLRGGVFLELKIKL
jgi:hypothetical protein